MIVIKSQRELDKMRRAGEIVALVLKRMAELLSRG